MMAGSGKTDFLFKSIPLMVHSDLVYDIGAHHGNDTAWYLANGYRVVAVEANPLLAKDLEKTFSDAIKAGNLTVLNVAVAANDNETIPFFISQDNWRSSAIKSFAEREVAIEQTVELTTTSLSSLFEKYGTPHYCKIDIEGNDAVAIGSLAGKTNQPSYISCEIACNSLADIQQDNHLLFVTIDALQAAGYTSFQLIDQESLLQLTDENYYHRIQKFYSRVRTKLERLTGWYTSRFSNRHLVARTRKVLPDYVTTPFGKALSGTWTDYETTRKYIQRHYNDFYATTKNKQLIFWVDIHARS
jgi:FkbM family methyltransferase